MNPRLRKIAKWLLFPAFYLFCLFIFTYLTFPYDRLKDRIITEFDKGQKKTDPPQRLEIETIDSYWFTGVELTGVRIITPPKAEDPRKASAAARAAARSKTPKTDEDEEEEGPAKPSIMVIDEVHARATIWSLLTGDPDIEFWASGLGGEVSGTIPTGEGALKMELESIELGYLSMVKDSIGMPLSGRATGTLSLDAPEGKFDKANGSMEMTIEDMTIFDGKTKVGGKLSFPRAKLGTLTIKATATDGLLKVDELSAQGKDLDIIGEGRVNVKKPWDTSNLDVFVRFRFSDAYRMTSDKTKSLLGEPGSPLPSLMEQLEPKVKAAKRDDGFYGFHIHGVLKDIDFDAAPTGKASPSSRRGATTPSKSPISRFGPRTTGRLPVLPKPATDDDDEDASDEDDADDPTPSGRPTPLRPPAKTDGEDEESTPDD